MPMTTLQELKASASVLGETVKALWEDKGTWKTPRLEEGSLV